MERVKTSKLFDRKRNCITLILCHLRSKIDRQFSRNSNVKLSIAIGIRSFYKCAALLFFFSSCVRVDTNTEPIFSEVKEEIAQLTNEKIYWDSSINNAVETVSVEELLQQELTEDFVVQIALLNNQSLQSFYESLGIAKANLAQAALLKNPIFSFANEFSTQSAITDRISIGLFQNFLDLLLIPLKKKAAQSELETTKFNLISKILGVITETKIAFYSLQASEKIWNLKKEILLATSLSYEASQKLFQAGNIKELTVSMERSLYEQAKLEVANWEIVVLEKREKLNVLMGLWGHQIDWKISPTYHETSIQKKDYDNIENEAITKSLDLKIAFSDLITTAASFGIDTTRFIFPQLNIGVSSEREDGVWYVGPAFSIAIPLFDFGQANSAKAEATIMQKWDQYTALAIEIRSKARSARFSFLNAQRQSQYLEKVIIPLAEQITHSVLLQHNAMQMGIFDLLLVKKQELERKIQFVQMHKEYKISKITLETLLNGHML